MPLIRRRGPTRKRQPQKPATLNRAHPLSAGLAGVWLFSDSANPVEMITGRVPTLVGAPGIVATPHGRGLRTSNPNHIEHTGGYDVVGSDWTIVTVGTILGESSCSSMFSDDYTADTVQYSLGFAQDGTAATGANNLQVGFYNAAWFKAVDPVQLVFGESFVAVGTKTAAAVTLYKNGKQIATGGSGTTPAKADGQKTYIGRRHDVNGSTYFNGAIALQLFYRRALTASEVAIISSNPWQIFKSATKDSWFAAASIGVQALAGNAAAQAVASAALSVSVPLAGASLSTATTTGALSIGVNIAGGAGAEAAASATLTTAATAALSGAAGASTNAPATLSLAVTLSATALVQALALAGLSQGVRLTGGDGAQAAASGIISLNLSLAGNPIAQAAASAGLTVTSGSSLAGNAAASAISSASLNLDVPLAAAALTVAATTGNITHLVPLIAAAASASQTTGGLDIAVRINAAALAQALAAAGLTVGGGMSGNAVAQPGATGTITLRVNLDTAAVVQAIAAGALTGTGLLAGSRGYLISRTARNWSINRTARNWSIKS